MALLKQVTGNDITDRNMIEDEIVIGRHPRCQIVIDDNAVSRKHCRFVLVDGFYTIEDLGSHNGTYLNGERLQGSVVLTEGDEISFCDYLFRFYNEASVDIGEQSGLVFQ